MKQVVWLYGYNLNMGGVETQMLSLLGSHHQTEYRWLIVSQSSPRFAARAAEYGAELAHWRLHNAFDVFAFIRLFFLLRHYRPTVLHIHSPNAALMGTWISRLLSIPCVVTIHLPLYYFVAGRGALASLKRRLYEFAERISQRLATKVIYVSAQVYSEALALQIAPRHSQVIANGVEINQLGEHRLLRRSDVVNICCVGRLEYQKGIDVLIQAAALLRNQAYNFQIQIAGDGSQRVNLESHAKTLGVTSEVIFLGFRDDALDILSVSDVFVLPSRYETMSIALLEAMVAGLPCVVTNVGENEELITEGVEGYVVHPDDPAALAAALKKLIANSDLRRRMGQAARLKARQCGDGQMVERTMAVYESLRK
jgi:glycosyltransferase involved in cell wall biosynthesis